MLKINQELKTSLLLDDETRNNAPLRRVPRINVRAPQILQPLDEIGRTTMSDDSTQQRLQRFTALQASVYGPCRNIWTLGWSNLDMKSVRLWLTMH